MGVIRKKIFGGIPAILALAMLSGSCEAFASTRVSTSILPQAFFIERVAGLRAAVHVMIPKGASPETYEPSPQQLVALSGSALYVKVGAPGLPLEEKYLRTAFDRNRRMTVVNMSGGVTFRKGDPHVWTSPSAIRIGAQNIAAAFMETDPANSAEYRSNLLAFHREIDALDIEIRQQLQEKKGHTFMVFHPAWGYFADEYGLVQLAIEEEGKPVSAAHIRRMVDLARAKGIRSLFVQKGFDAKSARAIAREIGGEVIETDPLERDWIYGMRSFVRVLSSALKK